VATNFVNLAGLANDIVGAFLLGRAVAFNSKRKIAQQVGTAWGYNKQLIPTVVEGRVDAVVGLSLLISGFLLQAVSVFWSGEGWMLSASLVILALIVVGYRMMLPKLVQRQTDTVVEFIENSRKKS
jgi:hypothetical protein